MPVNAFVEIYTEEGPYGLEQGARIHAPSGKFVDVNPNYGFTIDVTHRGNKNGFGLEIRSRTKTTLTIGNCGDTSEFLKSLVRALPPRSNSQFWESREMNRQKTMASW